MTIDQFVENYLDKVGVLSDYDEKHLRSALTQLLDELGEEIVQRSVSNNFFKSERFTKTDEVLSAIARIRGGKNDQ